MHAKDAIRQTLAMSERILTSYLNDLDDADFRSQPVPGMNPIAWQVGHLIVSERGMLDGVKPGASPDLPEGFADAHPRDPSQAKPEGFVSKDEYLKLWKAQHEATLAALDAATDDQLDAPGPERMRSMAPTVGAVLNMTGLHTMMHVGQFVAVRRTLNKPVAI